MIKSVAHHYPNVTVKVEKIYRKTIFMKGIIGDWQRWFTKLLESMNQIFAFGVAATKESTPILDVSLLSVLLIISSSI